MPKTHHSLFCFCYHICLICTNIASSFFRNPFLNLVHRQKPIDKQEVFDFFVQKNKTFYIKVSTKCRLSRLFYKYIQIVEENMTRKKPYLSVSDFFNDDNFIAWRLFRSEELNRHWNDFVKGNPETVSLLHEACNRFDAVKLNKSNLTSGEEEKLYTKIVTRINKHNHQTKKSVRSIGYLRLHVCLFWLARSSF